MLDIEGLSLRTRDRSLVQDISFTLPERGITALIGPSGCGKTTVLRWLAGLLPAAGGIRARGVLRLAGAEIRPPHRAIAFQPQSDALFPWLTIARNAALGLELAGLSRRAARARVAPLFADFGLAGCEDLWPAQLSGGMRQRAAFLRTIVQDSRFVLLDEPFSALDAVTRLQMQSWLLAQLQTTPRGVLMVTHDLHEATALADQILVMAAGPGRIIARIDLTDTPRTDLSLAPVRAQLKSLLLKEPLI